MEDKTIKEEIEYLVNKVYNIEDLLNQYSKDIDYMLDDVRELSKKLEELNTEISGEKNENK